MEPLCESPTMCIDLHNQFQITEYCVHLPPPTFWFFYSKVPEILYWLLLHSDSLIKTTLSFMSVVDYCNMCARARVCTHVKNEIKINEKTLKYILVWLLVSAASIRIKQVCILSIVLTQHTMRLSILPFSSKQHWNT
jgi:hypothetical protein